MKKRLPRQDRRLSFEAAVRMLRHELGWAVTLYGAFPGGVLQARRVSGGMG